MESTIYYEKPRDRMLTSRIVHMLYQIDITILILRIIIRFLIFVAWVKLTEAYSGVSPGKSQA